MKAPKKMTRFRLLKRRAAIVAIGLTISGGVTSADENELSVTVHSGYAGATEILNGDFDVGEQRTTIELNVAKRRFNRPSVVLELHNNLCVSQIMQQDNLGALESCERAVDQAKRTKAEGRQSRKPIHKLHAIAYLNRGVSRALSENTKQAIDDFNTALLLEPEFDDAAKNLAVVRLAAGRPAVATVREHR